MKRARLMTSGGVVEGRYEDGTVIAEDGEYDVRLDGSLISPCAPSTVYCVGRNFAETLDQMDYKRPEEPDFFIKPQTSIIGPNHPIRYPSWADKLTYAGELAAVIDHRCQKVATENVEDILRGYTIMNDMDALDQPGRTARKAFDGSAPLGPWIETDLDPTAIDIHTKINGEQRQTGNTDQMIFDVYEIISFLSDRFTFSAGDVVAFGSPANPGTVKPGDEIEITYEGIGTLQNTIIEAQ